MNNSDKNRLVVSFNYGVKQWELIRTLN
jgi:hypothetical protein